MKLLRLLAPASLALAGFLGAAPPLHAVGVPEPPVTVFGQIQFSDGLVWSAAGTVDVSFTPVSGGATVSGTTFVEPLAGTTPTFSYRVKLPVETVLPGQTASGDAFVIPPAPILFNRSVTFTIGPNTRTVDDQVTLGPADFRRGLLRVDGNFLDTTPPVITPSPSPSPSPSPPPTGTPLPTASPTPFGCPLGDADGNGVVNAADYASVRDTFGTVPFPSGDANCDGFVNLSDFSTVREVLLSPNSLPLVAALSAKSRLYLSPESASVAPDTDFSMEVRLDTNGHAPAVIGAFISYDDTHLTFLGGSTNTAVFNNANLTAGPYLRETSIISFPAVAIAPVSGTGIVVATLNFHSLAAGSAPLSFHPGDTLPVTGRDTGVLGANLDAIVVQIDDPHPVSISAVPSPRLFIDPAVLFTNGIGNYSVDVRLDTNGRPAQSAVVYVQFDSNIASFVSGSINTGSFADSGVNSPPALSGDNVVALTAASTSVLAGNDIPVATLTFAPLANGSMSLSILQTAQRPSRVLSDAFVDLGATVSHGFVTQENYVPPTPSPTPSASPTESPTPTPSATVTATGTATPTATPVVTITPTATPTATAGPTATPTAGPTATATLGPTATATLGPTATPTSTAGPTATPSASPTASITPTPAPSPTPVNPGDSDGDGFSNNIEAFYGSDPNDPASVPPLGDFDGSGSTNLGDALALARAAAASGGTVTPYDARYDLDLDSDVDATDAEILLEWSLGEPGRLVLPLAP